MDSPRGFRWRRTRISGPIPPAIAKLQNLTHLYLFATDISGSIPKEIGDMENLQYLHLEQTDLSGPIPPQIGR